MRHRDFYMPLPLALKKKKKKSPSPPVLWWSVRARVRGASCGGNFVGSGGGGGVFFFFFFFFFTAKREEKKEQGEERWRKEGGCVMRVLIQRVIKSRAPGAARVCQRLLL